MLRAVISTTTTAKPIRSRLMNVSLRFRHRLAAVVVVPEDGENRDADPRQRSDETPPRIVDRGHAARVEVVASQQDGVERRACVDACDRLR
jgi:hypothetical protein